jgi:hypothetical protein
MNLVEGEKAQVWECFLRPGQRPAPDCDDWAREGFIRDKYVRRSVMPRRLRITSPGFPEERGCVYAQQVCACCAGSGTVSVWESAWREGAPWKENVIVHPRDSPSTRKVLPR